MHRDTHTTDQCGIFVVHAFMLCNTRTLQLHGMQGEVRAEATSLRNDRDALEKRVTDLEEDLQRTENKLEKVLLLLLYTYYAAYIV
jgi:uncharacterized protein YlxW (UPF0749 family)